MSGAGADTWEQDTLLRKRQEEEERRSGGGGGLCCQCFETKTTRLSVMLAMIVAYFFAEVIVGHMTNSLTLVADSFHMLSDGLSLCVALIAVRMSKRLATQPIRPWLSRKLYFNTFGWARFEVVGALVNSTFLLALCVSIFLEAMEKFMHPELTSDVELVLAVGAGGLVINLIGLAMFGSHDHGHSHGGHSHGSHSHGHRHAHDDHDHEKGHEETKNDHGHHHGAYAKSDEENHEKSDEANRDNVSKRRHASGDQMNMKAVFLHVLGDALGSVIVMVTALVVMFVPHDIPPRDVSPSRESAVGALTSNETTVADGSEAPARHGLNTWIVYVDPAMSLVLVLIMVTTTAPLFKQSSLILLQTVPKHIELAAIKERINKIEGVKNIHDFHVWQLTGENLVATVHLQCEDSDKYEQIAAKIRERFNDAGINTITVQPEFHQTDGMCATQCCSANDGTKRCFPTPPPTLNVRSGTTLTNVDEGTGQSASAGSAAAAAEVGTTDASDRTPALPPPSYLTPTSAVDDTVV